MGASFQTCAPKGLMPANKAATYFDQYYGSGIKDYVAGSSDYFDRNSFINNGYPSYNNPYDNKWNYWGYSISSKFHWTDIAIYIPLLGLVPALFY